MSSNRTQPFFPAARFATKQARDRKRAAYIEWSAGVPTSYLEKFVEKGLTPFLTNHGYRLIQNPTRVVQSIRQWAFSHVWIHRNPSIKYQLHFLQSSHAEGEEARDWYQFKISPYEWMDLTHQWNCTEFLDDSDMGLLQRDDFANCIWYLLDLLNSRSHQKWVETLSYEDMEDEYGHGHGHGHPHEESAFSFDKHA